MKKVFLKQKKQQQKMKHTFRLPNRLAGLRLL